MKILSASLLSMVLCVFSVQCFAGPNEDLIAACKAGNLEGAKKAIADGANVNALDEAGNPAISNAFFWPDIVKVLLENKADPNLGNSPVLFSASVYYSTEVIKLALEAGADPNKPGKSDPSTTFKNLIANERKKGKDANEATIKAWESAMKTLKPSDLYTLPTLIMGTNCVPCLQMLLDKGAKVDAGVTDGTLLHTLAGYGNSREARKKACADSKAVVEGFGMKVPDWYANISDERNGTPEDMLKLLLAKGLDINGKNKGVGGIPPQTPLEVSLGGGLLNKPEVSLALINNGANVNVSHEWYGPAILQAAQIGSVDVLKAMLEKGADINTEGKCFTDSDNGAQIKNFTALTCAAAKNHPEAVKFLLEKGAKTQGIGGSIVSGACPGKLENKSAVYFAIEHKNMDMVKIIVEGKGFNGQNLSISAKKMTNCVGGGSYSPSKYAKEVGVSDIADYLKGQGM